MFQTVRRVPKRSIPQRVEAISASVSSLPSATASGQDDVQKGESRNIESVPVAVVPQLRHHNTLKEVDIDALIECERQHILETLDKMTCNESDRIPCLSVSRTSL